MLDHAAQRGHNIGSIVRGLLELLDTYGAAMLEDAVSAANAAQRVGVSAVRTWLEARTRELGRTAPRPVQIKNEALKEVVVPRADLSVYDELAHLGEDADASDAEVGHGA